MNHPWGLSGVAFLWIYGIAIVAALGFAIHWRGRDGLATRSEPATPIDDQLLGYLVQGPRRAVEVAVARLLDTGGARVTPAGALAPTETAAARPFDRAVQGRLGTVAARSAGATVSAVATSSVVAEPRDRLVRQGLTVSRRAERRGRWQGTIPMWALFAVGGARFDSELAADDTSSTVVWFLLGTAAMLLGLTFVATDVQLTSEGWRVRKAARHGPAHPLLARIDLESTGARVALHGLAAYPDATVRAVLGGQARVSDADA